MRMILKVAVASAFAAGLSLSMAPAFAQSGTGAQGSPGGAGTGGDSGTGAPLTGGGSQGAPMKGDGTMMKSDSMSKGTMSTPAAPATSTENKPTATGGQPGGNATTGR